MPIDDAALMAAMDAGIAGEAPPTAASTTDTSQETDDATDTGTDADADDGATDIGGEADGKGADADKEGEPAGSDKPVAGAPANETPEQKATREAAEAAAKPKDPVNDPVPHNLKKETGERMKSLIGIVKEKDTALQTVTTQFNEVMGLIQETRATPQQYGQALDYLRMVNSGDPIQQKAAIQVMQRELAALSKIVGVPVPGVDVLSAHPDLVEKVNDGTISREDAEELAAARDHRTMQTQHSEHRTQQTREEQAYQTALDAGRTALNELGATLAASDSVNYAYKKAILLPALQPVLNELHPSKWAKAFTDAYNKLPAAPKPAAAPTPAIPANQPRRAQNPAGGQQKAASSLFEAIDMGIANANGGR